MVTEQLVIREMQNKCIIIIGNKNISDYLSVFEIQSCIYRNNNKKTRES